MAFAPAQTGTPASISFLLICSEKQKNHLPQLLPGKRSRTQMELCGVIVCLCANERERERERVESFPPFPEMRLIWRSSLGSFEFGVCGCRWERWGQNVDRWRYIHTHTSHWRILHLPFSLPLFFFSPFCLLCVCNLCDCILEACMLLHHKSHHQNMQEKTRRRRNHHQAFLSLSPSSPIPVFFMLV